MTTTANSSQGSPIRPSERVGTKAAPILRSVRTGPRPESESQHAIRDRVVRRLVADGHLDSERVESFLRTWYTLSAQGAHEPFWRFVARQEGVDASVVKQTAAALYGFRTARVTLPVVRAQVESVLSVWPTSAISRLAGFHAVPMIDEEPHRPLVASTDPTVTELGRLLDSMVDGPYELRYATDETVTEWIEAFRRWAGGR